MTNAVIRREVSVIVDMNGKAHKISVLGTFFDGTLEREFFDDYMMKSLRYIRPIILTFGILNTLFTIPDYFFAKDHQAFLNILTSRVIFLLFILLFFFIINRFRNYKLLALWITVYEILGSISFLFIFGQYGQPNFLIQAFGVIVVILVIFTVPNKWIYMLGASVFVSIAFFIFARYTMSEIACSDYLAGIVYVLVVLILSSMGAFRSNYYSRQQYITSKELLNLSSIDGLTGIYNRTKWDRELDYWLTYSKRYHTPLSVIFFDIDDFKNINDLFGHLAGDRAIVQVAEIVKSGIRESDVFARWGGDEFMLLLPNTDMQQALALAERLRVSVSSHHFEDAERITCSFGLAVARETDSADRLVSRTDQLLYTSKLKGKNLVTC